MREIEAIAGKIERCYLMSIVESHWRWVVTWTTADVITRVWCRVPMVVTVRSIVGH